MAFLRQRFPQMPVTDWQRALAQADHYPQWLAAVTGNQGGPALAMGWHSYLYDRAGDGESAAAPQAPAEDLLLLCEGQDARRRLMRFDPETETFSREVAGSPSDLGAARPVLAPAPPDGAFFGGYDDGVLKIWRWQDGQQRLLWESEPAAGVRYRFEGASPHGHFVVVQVSDPQRPSPVFRVAQVSACLDGDCNWRQTVYRPTWSPDDRYVIWATTRGNMLHLAQAGGPTQSFWHMDAGSDPLWLDVETFAYLKQREGELSAVVLTAVDRRRVQTLLDVADLRPQLSADVFLTPTIGLARHPADDNVLFVALQAVHAEGAATTYVYLARQDTGQLFRLFSTTNGDPQSLTISPAGRWLALATGDGLLVYDLVMDRGGAYAQGRPQIGPLWSPGGDWLFSGSEGRYTLIAPGRALRVIQPEALACDAAIWLGSDGPA